MPKFHCIHCGQRIDAPDQLAGTNASCPTCGGEIVVPDLPDQPRTSIEHRHTSETTTPAKNPATSASVAPSRAEAEQDTLGENLDVALHKSEESKKSISKHKSDASDTTLGCGCLVIILAFVVYAIVESCSNDDNFDSDNKRRIEEIQKDPERMQKWFDNYERNKK